MLGRQGGYTCQGIIQDFFKGMCEAQKNEAISLNPTMIQVFLKGKEYSYMGCLGEGGSVLRSES